MISPEVMQELLSVRQVLHYLPESAPSDKGWTEHEQHLFWVALAQHPQGPWTAIAEFIGTKSARQAMTHGQKLRQKLRRWNERLRSNPTASMLMDGRPWDAPIRGIFQAPGGEFNAGLMVDDVSIVDMDDFRSSDYNMNTTRVVELMLSETSEEVTVTDFSDDPEMLPQDLLDDLLDILSDDDLNELNQHHHRNPNMP
ncbi:hypothetical protein Pcac1_g10187 [Phytophthora cactorum]|uniref:Myb-like domain-containing protein n=1 Tax=Phytophthora cactorum TaxID=29920 RepID=A0A8T1DR93_9STRA|nr:hypothetical protein Pcac1_g10187 [Phytophthora cactorum]KAG2928607.1 hypothetical protein PC114_g3090 [Phytophthora cactorum]KAG2943126.1 hypothetical protein PC115_g1019 [Phytophthora cactorum]